MSEESNEVSFHLLDQDDPEHEAQVGDLLIVLNPHDFHITSEGQAISIEGGYHHIADLMERRHSGAIGWGWAAELADLFEGVLCNSDWDWVPGDDEMALSHASQMYVDNQGTVQILLQYWQFDHQAYGDPIETLFCKGYIVFTKHDDDTYRRDIPDYLFDLFRSGSVHFDDAWKVWEMAGKPEFRGITA